MGDYRMDSWGDFGYNVGEFLCTPLEVFEMKILITGLLTALLISSTVFAGSANSGPMDLRSLGGNLWKYHRSTLTSSQKNDMAIVYGGEDVYRRISDNRRSA